MSLSAGLLNLSPTNGGTVTDDLDALVDAIATIEDASGSATHIVCSPSSWADLSKFKQATDSNMSVVGAGTTAPTRTLLSVPVLVSNSKTDGTMLVLDRNSVLSVYGDVQLATSTDFYFGSDNIALRATFRFGQKIADIARGGADGGRGRQLALARRVFFSSFWGRRRGWAGPVRSFEARPHL